MMLWRCSSNYLPKAKGFMIIIILMAAVGALMIFVLTPDSSIENVQHSEVMSRSRHLNQQDSDSTASKRSPSKLHKDSGSKSPPANHTKITDILKTKNKSKNLKHGIRLTGKQKSTLAKMTPQDRKELEDRISMVETKERKQLLMMRLLNELSDLERVRRRNQVKSLPDGSEYVLSTPDMPVSFPPSLKKIYPLKWPEVYKVLKNITHYPWPKDPLCSNYSVVFHAPNSHPTKGLVSFPSSGNTWTRYLIESATGIFTGSFYDDTDILGKAMYGEGVIYDSGMTILQKSHGFTSGPFQNLIHPERMDKNHLDELNHSGVIVIRNPFKTIISHRNLDLGVGHTGFALEKDFIGPGWTKYVSSQIKLWREFYIDWLTKCNPKNLHITYYELLKDNPIKEIRNILKFLELPVEEGRLKCIDLHTDGHFKRKHSSIIDNQENPYTEPLKKRIYQAIDDVNKVLKKTGKETLPVDKYEMFDTNEAKHYNYIHIENEKQP